MGKPDKAVYIPSRIALPPDEGASARPGSLSARAEVFFPFRFCSVAGGAVSSFSASLRHPIENRLARRGYGAPPAEPFDGRKCGLHGAAPSGEGRHAGGSSSGCR